MTVVRKKAGLWLWLLPCLAVVLASSSATAQPACTGDCDGDGSVTVAELVLGINVALGLAVLGSCDGFDTNEDGEVTVDELVGAVQSAVSGCGVFIADGTCFRPGAQGLDPCQGGTAVQLSRCEDRATCLSDSGRTVLGEEPTGDDGDYTFTVPDESVTDRVLLLEAEVDPSKEVTYRVLDFGPITSGALARAVDGGGTGIVVISDIVIDPASEAAVRLLGECGLDAFTNDGIREVQSAVREANTDTSFAGLTADAAADLATETARNDPLVEQAIARNKLRFGVVTQRIGPATGTPGETVSIEVSLFTADEEVVGTENRLQLGGGVQIRSNPDGTPDCIANPQLSKQNSAFSFEPSGCAENQACEGIKAFVLSFGDLDPIPNGSVLYSCNVTISDDATPGEHPVTCLDARFSPPPVAPIPAPPADCVEAEVVVTE